MAATTLRQIKICLTTPKLSQVTDILLRCSGVFNFIDLHHLVSVITERKVTVISLFLQYNFWVYYPLIVPPQRLIRPISAESEQKTALLLLFNILFFTQQYSWTQNQIEFCFSVTRDILMQLLLILLMLVYYMSCVHGFES